MGGEKQKGTTSEFDSFFFFKKKPPPPNLYTITGYDSFSEPNLEFPTSCRMICKYQYHHSIGYRTGVERVI